MDIEYDGFEGDFLQAGCGLGGAAIVIAHAKRRSRFLAVHDPFGAGPDLDERLNVQFVPGEYEKTLASDGALALAHVDCGEYGPMCVLLERLAPRLVSGGHLIVDDYRTHEECRQAVDEYFRGKKGFQLVRKSRLHVIRS